MADEPTVLGLLVAGQERLEAAVTAGFSELRTELGKRVTVAEMRRYEAEVAALEPRIDRLEQARTESSLTERLAFEARGRAWTRREKLWGAVGVVVTVTGIWFGPIVARGIH